MTALLKNGAMILLVTALVVLVCTFGYQFFVIGDLDAARGMGPVHDRLTLVMTALATALYNAALPFIGACIVDRMDRYLASKGSAE